MKPLLGHYCCENSSWSTVTALTEHHISQLHSVVSNHIHSYSTGSNGLTEKNTTVPEDRKSDHAHSHIKQYFVIKFSQIPRSSTWQDSLLWGLQGCQDHHDDSKLLSTNPLFSPQFLNFPPLPTQNVPQFKSESREESLSETPGHHCRHVSGCWSIHKSIMIRHREGMWWCGFQEIFCFLGGWSVGDEKTAWLAWKWFVFPPPSWHYTSCA